MELKQGDTVRFYAIRFVADPVRYEPRNVGVLAWEVGAFQPMAHVDAQTLLRCYKTSWLWTDITATEATQAAANVEASLLKEIEGVADSDSADELIKETCLCHSYYPPLYVVERPGTILISNRSFELDARYQTLAGCIERMTERLVLSTSR